MTIFYWQILTNKGYFWIKIPRQQNIKLACNKILKLIIYLVMFNASCDWALLAMCGSIEGILLETPLLAVAVGMARLLVGVASAGVFEEEVSGTGGSGRRWLTFREGTGGGLGYTSDLTTSSARWALFLSWCWKQCKISCISLDRKKYK